MEELRPEKSKGEDCDPPEKSPRRGPTLSTSTSSFEALDPHDPQLNHLASVMFSKSSDWITGSAFFSKVINFLIYLNLKGAGEHHRGVPPAGADEQTHPDQVQRHAPDH